MSPSNGGKAPATEVKTSALRSFLSKLRKRHIIETFAAFIAGGWLILEFVDRMLIAHYHFPDKIIDITFITLLCALICTLLWRWFSGREELRKFKLELVLIPLAVLITVLLDINLILHLKGPEPEPVPAAKWKNSIAVLPFVDMSPQKDQEYFCDGMTEELINRLSKIKNLRVPARTSAFSFKGKTQDMREIGKKLSVGTVLEGSVRKAGNQLRVTAQLINIADDSHLWSDTYDRELKDVFSIQDEISLQIINKLKIELLGEERARVAKRHTDNTGAYQAYLKGRFHWNKRTPEGMRKSIEYFEQAIEKDPSYALAYVGIADSYITMVLWRILPAKEALPKAKEAAMKALKIDNSLGEAHNSLATVIFGFDWDWKEAEKEYQRAIELSPSYATAHQWYGEFLTYRGRFDEGLREIRRAQELDPLSLVISAVEGLFFYLGRDYDRGIEQSKKTLELDPDFPPAHLYLSWNYYGKGIYEEALSEAQKSGDQYWIVSVYVAMNKHKEARRMLDRILKQPQQSEMDMARIYFQLGENEEGWKWLEKAYDERSFYLTWLKLGPFLDNIRSDPRYAALLKKVGLEK